MVLWGRQWFDVDVDWFDVDVAVQYLFVNGEGKGNESEESIYQRPGLLFLP